MSVGRRVIAIDIDDTLFDHFVELATWYNARYGTELGLADNHPKGVSALRRWRADSIDQAVRRVHKFYDTSEFLNAEPYADAVSVIKKLAENYSIAFVTARDADVLETFTHEWIERHFCGLHGGVYFTAQYSLRGRSRTKLEVCREIDAKVLVDDSLENCIDMASDGRIGLLYGNYPWNADYDGRMPGVVRVADWSQVAEEVNRFV